jgi:hypothetical protein
MLNRLTVASEGLWITSQLFLIPITPPLLSPSLLCPLSQSLFLKEVATPMFHVRLHRPDKMSVAFNCTTDVVQQIEATRNRSFQEAVSAHRSRLDIALVLITTEECNHE